MKKFEYKLIHSTDVSQVDLNGFGQEGWEVIAVTANHDLSAVVFWMKRELEDKGFHTDNCKPVGKEPLTFGPVG